MDIDHLLVGIDIGTGLGAKMGLFADPSHQLGAGLLRRGEFGDDFQQFVGNLQERLNQLLSENCKRMNEVRAIGVASPGLLCSDGSYLLAANVPLLTGHNLKQRLAAETGIPVAIDNDANAGGLAEWSAMRTELLYWVFGGGWGGAWIDGAGTVRFPALDWDGDDKSLHYTNEPGYAIPLDKLMLKTLFYQFGALLRSLRTDRRGRIRHAWGQTDWSGWEPRYGPRRGDPVGARPMPSVSGGRRR